MSGDVVTAQLRGKDSDLTKTPATTAQLRSYDGQPHGVARAVGRQ
jgi:hypothetical protein